MMPIASSTSSPSVAALANGGAKPTAAPTKSARAPQVVLGGSRRRQKKGPRRVNKRVTAADLDQEMDDYHAAATES